MTAPRLSYRTLRFAALCTIGLMMNTSQAQTKHILDLKVDSFKTGLEEVGNSFWVDSNQFVMTTLQEGAQQEFREEDAPSRIALVNFANKTIKYIAQDAQVLDFTFDRKKGSIFIGKMHTTTVVGPDKRSTSTSEYVNLREIRIESDGRATEIRKYPPGSKPPILSDVKDGISLDGDRGGVLVRDLAPGDTYMKQWERLIKNDEGLPTVWVRRGKPDMPLPIRYDEIDSGEYVAFLDKYLLNNYDTKSDSKTNSHRHLVWKRPYEYTPFRLLGQDGSIEEIPYPEFVFEYGLSRHDKPDGEGPHFNRFLITKVGIVVQKVREYGSALYLFKNNQLYLIAGGKTSLHVDRAENPAEGIQTTVLSPDGCKLAYSHLKGLAATSKYGAPRFVNIVDLCRSSQ